MKGKYFNNIWLISCVVIVASWRCDSVLSTNQHCLHDPSPHSFCSATQRDCKLDRQLTAGSYFQSTSTSTKAESGIWAIVKDRSFLIKCTLRWQSIFADLLNSESTIRIFRSKTAAEQVDIDLAIISDMPHSLGATVSVFPPEVKTPDRSEKLPTTANSPFVID